MLDLTTNTYTTYFKRLADTFDDIFDQFHDITNDQYTHAQRTAQGQDTKLSRIDRTYDNTPTTYLRDRHPTLRQLWPATTTTAISDHTPIIYTSQGFSDIESVKTPCMPRWLAEHARFPTILRAIMESKRDRADPKLQHIEDKASLYAAAREWRSVIHEDKAQTSDAKLALAIQAARAHHKRNLTSLAQAVRSFQQFGDFFRGTRA